MIFFEFTEKHFVQHFSTITRCADISPKQLSDAHKFLGRYLAENIAEFISLNEIQFQHTQGIKTGRKLNENDVVILSFMRAGLYVSDGIREVFNFAPLELVKPIRNEGFCSDDLNRLSIFLKNKHVIIADAVINTGNTLFPAITQLMDFGVNSIHVATLVMPIETAEYIKSTYSKNDKLYIHTARVSENSYVGKGNTDTGNRLFGNFYE